MSAKTFGMQEIVEDKWQSLILLYMRSFVMCDQVCVEMHAVLDKKVNNCF